MNVIDLVLVGWEMDKVTALLVDGSFCQFIKYLKATLKVYCQLIHLKHVLEISNVYIFNLGLWLNDSGGSKKFHFYKCPLFF